MKAGICCLVSDQFRSRRAGYGQVGDLIGFALAVSPLRWGFIRGRLLPSVRQFGRTGLRSRLGVTATHNPKSRLVGATRGYPQERRGLSSRSSAALAPDEARFLLAS